MGLELKDRPLVILLSLMTDGADKTSKEMTLGFSNIIDHIFLANNGQSLGFPRMLREVLDWHNSVELVIKVLRNRGFIALTDEESYKYCLTPLGLWFFNQHTEELEKHFGIKLR